MFMMNDNSDKTKCNLKCELTKPSGPQYVQMKLNAIVERTNGWTEGGKDREEINHTTDLI